MSKEENNKTAAQLADPVEFRFGYTTIKINARECDIPHIKGLSSGVDWKFLDMYQDVKAEINPISTETATKITDDSEELCMDFEALV